MRYKDIVIEQSKVRLLFYVMGVFYVHSAFSIHTQNFSVKNVYSVGFSLFLALLYVIPYRVKPKEFRYFMLLMAIGYFVSSVWNISFVPMSWALPCEYVGAAIHILSLIVIFPACGFFAHSDKTSTPDSKQVDSKENESEEAILHEVKQSLKNYMALMLILQCIGAGVWIYVVNFKIDTAAIIGMLFGLIGFNSLWSIALRKTLKMYNIRFTQSRLTAKAIHSYYLVDIEWSEIDSYFFVYMVLCWMLVIRMKTGRRVWIPVWRFDTDKITEYLDKNIKTA